MERKYKLFIPEVKTYGGVIILDDEPCLFILNDDKLLDGIPIFNDLDEFSEDIYLLLDNNEMILVGVDVVDNKFREVEITDITDENYHDFIYNLTPLKIHTVDGSVEMNDFYENGLLEDLIYTVAEDYKEVLELSKQL